MRRSKIKETINSITAKDVLNSWYLKYYKLARGVENNLRSKYSGKEKSKCKTVLKSYECLVPQFMLHNYLHFFLPPTGFINVTNK